MQENPLRKGVVCTSSLYSLSRKAHALKSSGFQDLKKQTAIRLAKEQQQNDEVPFVHDTSRSGYRSQEVHAATTIPYHHGPHPGSVFPHEIQTIVPNAYSHPIKVKNTTSYGRDAPSPVAKSNIQPRYVPEKKRVSSSSPIHSSSGTVDSKAKLPHGLTVHELKAMTKARLQAEASENGPVPTQAVLETRDRAPVRTPVAQRQNCYVGNLASATEGNFHQESWSIDSRNDPWETGSVNTQTSDYFGSEKGFAPLEDSVYGNRARSFSANAVGQDFRRDDQSSYCIS